MTKDEMDNLSRGDLVRSKSGDGSAWIVESNCGHYVSLVRSMQLTNANEWELVAKASYEHIDTKENQ